jgi:hypothetical protein
MPHCMLSANRLFSSAEATVTGPRHLDMLEKWLSSQSKKNFPGLLHVYKDGAPHYVHIAEGKFLNENLPEA